MTITRSAEATATPADIREMPAPEECLVCFVLSSVERAGCDNTLRWARTYRDAVAPDDHGLERRLEALGGYCDCEILMNAFVPASAADEDDWPESLPECAGVRRGSTVPCRRWIEVSRGRR